MKVDKSKAGKSTQVYSTKFEYGYLKPKYWGTWIAVFFLFIVYLFPISLQDAMSNKLGDLIRNINKKRRRFARTNIKLCFPELNDEEIRQIIRNNFRQQARSVLHLGMIWWASKATLEKRIIMQGQEHIEQSLNNNRGVIVMPAHSLALEAVLSCVAMRYTSSGFFNPMKNKLVDWFIAQARVRHGGFSYARNAGLRPIIKDVRAGCVALYLSDEDLGAERSIFAPFFGVQKASVPVLGRLAKSCRADVLPCMGCYDEEKHRYVITILPPLENFPQGDDYEDTLIMNQSLEKIIQICPSQYFWIMKMFKTRPEGEKTYY